MCRKQKVKSSHARATADLIAAASERVLAADVGEEVAEAERELEDDVGAARAEVIAELRAIGERLRQLEARL
jgi:hypothetical protein